MFWLGELLSGRINEKLELVLYDVDVPLSDADLLDGFWIVLGDECVWGRILTFENWVFAWLLQNTELYFRILFGKAGQSES